MYSVTRAGVHVCVLEDGAVSSTRLAATEEFLPLVDGLAGNLRDLTAVAEADLPRLEEFAAGWGRRLIPTDVLDSPPDVLVFIPHDFLHTLPLHLVRTTAGPPLALASGVAYSSSLSLFCRCASRNKARQGLPTAVAAAGFGVDVKAGDDRYTQLAASVLAQFGAEPDRPGSRRWAKQHMVDPNVDVVCLVVHGYLDRRAHRDSGLLVERHVNQWERSLPAYGGTLTFYDVPLRLYPATEAQKRPGEVLTLSELETVTSNSDLTLLLACSAGASRVLQCDEPASIAEAILRVGSASVVAPMWESRIDDAIEWTTSFIKAWRRDQFPKAMAAREAFRSLDTGGEVALLGPLHLRGDWV
jgi:CHAT domain-containing protein